MLTNFPEKAGLDTYHDAIDEMVELLKRYPGVYTIYQVGGLSSPGISDIDFFVVFEDDVKCEKQPLQEISSQARYLFTHSLFGAAKKHAGKLEQYTLFGNYRKLWGADFDVKAEYQEPNKDLEVQLALEYLLKMKITLHIEKSYRLQDVRNFLLMGKAIQYDLELLGIGNHPLNDLCEEVISYRNQWFEKSISHKQLIDSMRRFDEALHDLLMTLLNEHTLYLPETFKKKMARNMAMSCAEKLEISKRGTIVLPRLGYALMGRKYARLLNRLVEFTCKVPYKTSDFPIRVADRFEALREATHYNREYLPGFGIAGQPLNLFG